MAPRLRIVSSVRDVAREAWDALHGDDDSPFVAWEWLDALESTGCAAPRAGWQPHHFVWERDGVPIVAAPAYLKTNSEGEFVFDWAWADVAHRVGVRYYPKLVVAVPFTPATGRRLLRASGVAIDEAAAWLAAALREACTRGSYSSAHVLFPHRDEADALERAGLATRLGVQFHWSNDGYATFDDFLARFQSKRRNAIKRERSQLVRDATRVETLTGDAITPDLVEPMFAFYASTVDKFYYGRRYLNRAFFERIVDRYRDRLEWVFARDRDGRIIAGAFNARRGAARYGRYWGASDERPFLHFNVCFYHTIETSIRDGVRRFEPGAGGEHKLVRGFEPALTYSSHWIADPKLDRLLREYLSREGPALREGVRAELAQSPLRRKG